MPQLLRLFWLGVVVFAVFSVLSTGLLIYLQGWVYPYSDPVFIDSSFQTDFVLFGPRFIHLFGTSAFYAVPPPLPFTYPAPMAVVYRFFYRYTSQPHLDFLLVCYLAYIAAAAMFAHGMAKRRLPSLVAYAFAGTVVILSYPVVLQLFVANMEVIVWAVVALGMWAFVSDRNSWAATCFGLAASLKLFPFVYFALLLSRQKYKEIAGGTVVFAAATLASLCFLGPDVRTASHGTASGLQHFQDYYVLQFHAPESGMDHSLFAVIKLGLYHWGRLDLLRVILRPYLLTLAVAGVLLYFLRIRHLGMFNQILAITVVSVLLPPVSHDYTLLHLYTPFVMLSLALVASQSREEEAKRAAILLFCFLLLFSPENYLIHHAIRFAGQVKAAILLFLLVFALTTPLPFWPFPDWEVPALSPATREVC